MFKILVIVTKGAVVREPSVAVGVTVIEFNEKDSAEDAFHIIVKSAEKIGDCQIRGIRLY